MEMWTWWQWFLFLWLLVSVGVVIATRIETHESCTETNASGYVCAFVFWWIPVVVALLILLFPNWGIPLRNRLPRSA